jgi:hypothetical protein
MMETQPEGIQPQVLNRRPEEKEPLAGQAHTKEVQPLAAIQPPREKETPVQPKKAEKSQLSALQGAVPTHNLVASQIADPMEISTTDLPGMFL